MTRILLDTMIYDSLQENEAERERLASLVSRGRLEVVVTPKIVDELSKSPFGGVPAWFPVRREPEAVAVLGHARLGMARLSNGEVYEAHRGKSNKVPDAIIAHSADALADIAVSNDRRFRHRLGKMSEQCRVMSFDKFREWMSGL